MTPLRILIAAGADHYVVEDATGRVVAQGSREMCERIAAGRPVFDRQAPLWPREESK